MEIELKQVEYGEYFARQASNLEGQSLKKIIVEATSHPSLFAFSEILSVPNVVELKGTENGTFLDLLNIFAHGTWSDYKRIHASLPSLVPQQVLKLKQLTLLTLAETDKVLPYEALMKELDVASVRELEDFLIDYCMHVGIVKGKLDQLRRCFLVQFALGRDLRPEQLTTVIDMLSNWLSTSEDLRVSVQNKIKWADDRNEIDQTHRMEVSKRVEEVQKTLHPKEYNEFQGTEAYLSEYNGLADFEDDLIRTKRSRTSRHQLVFEETTLLNEDSSGEFFDLIAQKFQD